MNKMASEEYVEWRGNQVEIPASGYKPAGVPREYTAEAVLNTLETYFYNLTRTDYRDLIGNDPTYNVRDEERIEGHSPALLDVAIRAAVGESRNGLVKRLKRTLGEVRVQLALNQNP